MKNIILKTSRGTKKIGKGEPVFVVAEISANHIQNIGKAMAIIKEAAKAGADAVKLQTYTPDTMTIDSDKKWFMVGGRKTPKSWQGKKLYDLYEIAYTPWSWHIKLKKYAEKFGLVFFSTPFDETAVDFLEKLNVQLYKVASYEITDLPLLKKIAKTKKPVIISAGFSSKQEISDAIKTLKKNGTNDIIVLYCVTGYTDDPKTHESNLATIRDIQNKFNVNVGFSDNNGGIDIPIASVAAGACLIEKHVIMSRNDKSPDSKFSLEPRELYEMIQGIRKTELAFGKVHYGPVNESEKYNKRFRRSLFATQNIKKGEIFSVKNVRVIRPNFGLAPKYYEKVLGQKATKNIERGTPLHWKHIL